MKAFFFFEIRFSIFFSWLFLRFSPDLGWCLFVCVVG
jgi:hypothetical protein